MLVKEKYSIPDKPVLLFVGRLDPEKKVEEVLHAVARAEKKIDFCLVIVGKGTRKTALENLAKELGITDKVIFTGFVPDADLPSLYKISRSFIIASTAELLSLATLQAMATGLPIIAVNAGALSELVHDRINGFLYNAGDIDTLVENICNIILKDDLHREMSVQSLLYSHHHDIFKTVESFERIYSSTIEKKSVKRPKNYDISPQIRSI
jgi:glycosyltransferase involved in cell wall biosynthesis